LAVHCGSRGPQADIASFAAPGRAQNKRKSIMAESTARTFYNSIL
jgi:hypothetical protein